MNKKAQGGLSMNTIIAAVIAIIVLLLIVTFLTGGLGNIFGKIRDVFTGGTAGSDIELTKANCQNYCETAKTKTLSTDLDNVAYCTRRVNIDWSPKDNQIGDDEKTIPCWQPPINVHCTVSTTDKGSISDGQLCVGTPAQ